MTSYTCQLSSMHSIYTEKNFIKDSLSCRMKGLKKTIESFCFFERWRLVKKHQMTSECSFEGQYRVSGACIPRTRTARITQWNSVQCFFNFTHKKPGPNFLGVPPFPPPPPPPIRIDRDLTDHKYIPHPV